MRCVVCRQGEVSRGETTVTLERGECVVVFRGVPAEVCRDCGEYYLDVETAASLLASPCEPYASDSHSTTWASQPPTGPPLATATR